MHSFPESVSPESNIPSTLQTSPSHSSTELQSNQITFENSDKITQEDSILGSECNDECLGFKKSYSTKIQYNEDKEISSKYQSCPVQNDINATIPLYQSFKSDIMNINNRKMSSPICSYYNEYHKYLSETIDKNVVDYSKSKNFIDKETIFQNKQNSLHNNNNNSSNTTPPYEYIHDSIFPAYSNNKLYKTSNTHLYKDLHLNETEKENNNKVNDINQNKTEINGSKTPSIPNKIQSIPNPQIFNNKFGFPFSLGTHTPKIQGHNNIPFTTKFMPVPIFIHKGMNAMTPIYGHRLPDGKGFSHFQFNNAGSVIDNRKHKQFSERPGDWVCAKCQNLNFSFRLICNRCHLQKEESEKIGEAIQNNNKSSKQNSGNVNANNGDKGNESSSKGNICDVKENEDISSIKEDNDSHRVSFSK